MAATEWKRDERQESTAILEMTWIKGWKGKEEVWQITSQYRSGTISCALHY